MLLVPRTRQLLVDGRWHEKAAAGFEGADVDDEFLMARLLLLITYDTSVDLNRLLEEFQLEANIDNVGFFDPPLPYEFGFVDNNERPGNRAACKDL